MVRSPLDVPGMVSQQAHQVRRAVRDAMPVPDYWRPKTRADCSRFGRPCPYFGCRYNLSLHLGRKGGIRWREDPDPTEPNCALDVAERGPIELQRCAKLLGLTREWGRRSLLEGMRKLRLEIKGSR